MRGMVAAFSRKRGHAMSSAHRMLLFAALLTVGACTASLFRKPAGSVSSASVAQAEFPHRAAGAQIAWGPARIDRAPQGGEIAAAERWPDAAPAAMVASDALLSPPELPSQSPIGPFPLRAQPYRPLDGEELWSGSTPGRHRVADGDSLAALAERFLGDPNRAGEIAAANRGLVLPSGALPIGVDLTIPAAGTTGEIPKPQPQVDAEKTEALPAELIRPASDSGLSAQPISTP